MLQFVSEHCCYGKTPAQEMVIKDIVPSSAYHVSSMENNKINEVRIYLIPFTVVEDGKGGT